MKSFLPWVLGLAVILPAILPFFQDPLFKVHDYTHVVRLSEMYQTLTDGGLPPRWSKNLGFGYGMPLFSFYAPLPYYLGVFFHSAGLSFIDSVKALFILTFYASFMAMFYLLREFWKPFSAYLGALLFIYVPYRAVDTYVRGALGELYGILFIVLAQFCLVKLMDTKKIRWLVFSALTIGGLLLSHNIMALIGIPFLFGFSLWYLWVTRSFHVKSLAGIGLANVWGIGLSGFFVLPALLEKSFTSVDQLTQGGGDYAKHFVYLKQMLSSPFNYGGSIEGPFDGISFELGKAQLMFVLLAALLWWFKRKSFTRKQQALLTFGFIVFAASVFMMSFHAQPVWQLFPFLKYLQFPWRFLTLPMIVVPFVAGSVIDFAVSKSRLAPVITGVLSVMLLVLYVPLFQSDPKPSGEINVYETNAAYVQHDMSTVIPDYIHPNLSHLVLSEVKDISPPEARFYISGPGSQLTVLEDKAQSFKVQVTAPGSFTVGANIFDFPGWSWRINGMDVAYTVGKPLPTMTVSQPETGAGTYLVEGVLQESPVRKFADWISVTSFALIGLVGGVGLVKRKSGVWR